MVSALLILGRKACDSIRYIYINYSSPPSRDVNSPKPFDQFLEDKVPVENDGIGGGSANMTRLHLTKVVLHVTSNGVRDGENCGHFIKKDEVGLSGKNWSVQDANSKTRRSRRSEPDISREVVEEMYETYDTGSLLYPSGSIMSNYGSSTSILVNPVCVVKFGKALTSGCGLEAIVSREICIVNNG